jgi:membrane-bound serine protease (ClpP class)
MTPVRSAKHRPLLVVVAILLASAVLLSIAGPASAVSAVSLIELDSAITPVTVRLLASAIERAHAEGSQALIVQLNTPGGLERSMRSMVQSILASPIPVIVYVAPGGARAASAGVFITMAAHVAAMAPATNIGAAHPVAVGGGGDKEMIKKVENDAAAFARTIATERGRNAEWAEKAVRSSVSATEREAVKLKIVDLVAESVPDLLAKIDGRIAKTSKGQVTLATKGAPVNVIEVRFRDRFLALISDPNIAYLLMMAGMLGIFFELSNPGAILPGVIGGICLILAFYAFQSLPVNWAGLLLLLFGVVLLIAEVKVVSHGVLAVGGVVAMLIGSLMLYDSPETTGVRLSWYVVVPTVGTTAALVFFAVSMGIRALYRPSVTGESAMVGRVGVTRSALAPEGQVMIDGELWRAVSQDGTVAAGEPVQVAAIDGLTLKVIRSAQRP